MLKMDGLAVRILNQNQLAENKKYRIRKVGVRGKRALAADKSGLGKRPYLIVTKKNTCFAQDTIHKNIADGL